MSSLGSPAFFSVRARPTPVEMPPPPRRRRPLHRCALVTLVVTVLLGAGFYAGWATHSTRLVAPKEHVQSRHSLAPHACDVPERGVAGGLHIWNSSTLLFVSSCFDMHFFREGTRVGGLSSNVKQVIEEGSVLKFTELTHDRQHIYLSYVTTSGCVSLRVLVGVINDSHVMFHSLPPLGGCVRKPTNLHAAGGKLLLVHEEERLIVSVGDFLERESSARNQSSYLGKLWSVPLSDPASAHIVSYGHRNPQGLCATRDPTILLETEHGPKGGDEVNRINLTDMAPVDYGWPAVSHGDHYNGTRIPSNHTAIGAVEPLLYFPFATVRSHGISDCKHVRSDVFVMATLNGRRLYIAHLDGPRRLRVLTEVYVGVRVRTMALSEDGCTAYLLTEEPDVSSAVGPLITVSLCLLRY